MPTDPDSVETCYCATAEPFEPFKPGLRTKLEKNLQCSAQNRVAVCSVACLAWTYGDRGVKHSRLWPQTTVILPLETMPAKEDRIGA